MRNVERNYNTITFCRVKLCQLKNCLFCCKRNAIRKSKSRSEIFITTVSGVWSWHFILWLCGKNSTPKFHMRDYMWLRKWSTKNFGHGDWSLILWNVQWLFWNLWKYILLTITQLIKTPHWHTELCCEMFLKFLELCKRRNWSGDCCGTEIE